MQTTRADVVKIMARINLHFGGVYKNLSKEDKLTLVEDWTRVLSEYPVEVVNKAADKAIAHSEFAPRLATIVSHVEEMYDVTNDKAVEEQWARLRRDIYKVSELAIAIRYDYGERAERARDEVRKIYEALPEELQTFVGGTVEAFYGLSGKDEEYYDYEKGRFIRAYPSLKARVKTKAEMSDELKELVGTTFKGISGGTLNAIAEPKRS